MIARKISRRQALGRFSAGALLLSGLWPGAGRASSQDKSGAFRFLAVNDTHCLSSECGEYLSGVVSQMNTENAEFCLHSGDLTDQGQRQWMETVKDVFSQLRSPMYPVVGNHDYRSATDRQAFVETFPGRLNYYFEHRGWQFVGLDSTQGQQPSNTKVQTTTLRWIEDNLPHLDKAKPTVVFTHFPMGLNPTFESRSGGELLPLTLQDLGHAVVLAKYRPTNADGVLDRFREFNLQAIFSGHYHAHTECHRGATVLTTDRCCSLRRGNHDGTKEKGYFLCEIGEGKLTRKFVQYQTPTVLAARAGKG